MALSRHLLGRVRANVTCLLSGGRLLLSPTTKNKINNINHHIGNRYQPSQYTHHDSHKYYDDGGYYVKYFRPLQGFEDKGFVIDCARFAVDHYNQEENAQLQFVKVLKVGNIPNHGMDLEIILEVNDARTSALYNTVVHCRPWDGYKEVIRPLALGL